jgi:hypothetical protein
MAKRDFYDILGVNRDASEEEIKKALEILHNAAKMNPFPEGGLASAHQITALEWVLEMKGGRLYDCTERVDCICLSCIEDREEEAEEERKIEKERDERS